MKITEQTTLAELQEYLTVCGNPLVTFMPGHRVSEYRLYAIIHLTDVGTFTGGGNTTAEALEEAFVAFRQATLPKPLRSWLDGLPDGPLLIDGKSPEPDPTGEFGYKVVVDGDGARRVERLCHWCGGTKPEHPSYECLEWFGGPP